MNLNRIETLCTLTVYFQQNIPSVLGKLSFFLVKAQNYRLLSLLGIIRSMKFLDTFDRWPRLLLVQDIIKHYRIMATLPCYLLNLFNLLLVVTTFLKVIFESYLVSSKQHVWFTIQWVWNGIKFHERIYKWFVSEQFIRLGLQNYVTMKVKIFSGFHFSECRKIHKMSDKKQTCL